MESDNNAKRAQLTQAELTQLLAGMDVNGVLVTLAPAANEIIERLYQRLTSTRKPRVNLDNPDTLAHYTARLIQVLKDNRELVARGGRIIMEAAASKAIGLGRATVNARPELHAIYVQYKRSMSNDRPVTVNNDYD